MTAMDELPLVLVHVLPPFEIPFKGRLQSRFQLIDSSDSTFSPHARVLLCVGPAPVSSDTLRHLPSLQCIVGSSAGVDHIDLEECRRRGITVTNAGSSFCEDGADFAIGLLIDVLRRISAADRYVRAGLWPVKGDYPLGSKGESELELVDWGKLAPKLPKGSWHLAAESPTTPGVKSHQFHSHTMQIFATLLLIVTYSLFVVP